MTRGDAVAAGVEGRRFAGLGTNDACRMSPGHEDGAISLWTSHPNGGADYSTKGAGVGRKRARRQGSGRRREVVVENGEHYSSQRSSASAVSQRAAALRRRTWRSAPDGGAGAGAGLGAAVGLSASGGRSFAARAVEDRGLDVNSRRSWGGSDGNSAHLALWRMERLEGKSAAGMGRLEMRRAAEERVGESRAGLVGRCPGFPVLGL